jgi:hypothetical protein
MLAGLETVEPLNIFRLLWRTRKFGDLGFVVLEVLMQQ